MPYIVEAEAKAVCYGAPGPPIAFIMLGDGAVYDYEDPSVAKRFLDRGKLPENSTKCDEIGSVAFLDLAPDMVSRAFFAAGAFSACHATATCKDWRYSEAAQCWRDEMYGTITGKRHHLGCTAFELGELALSAQLIKTVTSKTACALPSQISNIENCTMSAASVSLVAGECVAVMIDAGTAFCVFRAGDLRCYRVDDGQLLGTCQRRLGKGTGIVCACLVSGEALVLGDSGGGLTLIMRDDLSDAAQLRQSAPAAVTSLVALGKKGALALRLDGLVEMVTVSQGESHGIHIAFKIDSGTMVPEMILYSSLAFICNSLDCVWVWDSMSARDTQPVQCCSDVKHGLQESPQASSERMSALSITCSMSIASQEWDAVVVMSSDSGCSLQWWSLLNSQLFHKYATDIPNAAGGVTALSSSVELVFSCHVDGSLMMWHLISRSCIIHVQNRSPGSCVFSRCSRSMAFAHVAERPGKGGRQSTLQFALAERQAKEPEVQEKKECKKEKHAKMFAHKSRGGKKNFDSKQTGRHTSLSKCTR
eukprot:TRINITY_DN81466_c0_g1_i1.p1 TRINITY_DN81466_c0_g1~~TRINITY_DN81466_c0_g1_i1.p1  ORF type:complete len:609 (-),score=97.42 TRINITY_DN81466_c0_g1_i1:123-1724(-)